MSKVPNSDQAVIPEAKITRYLLDLTSEHGRPKAQLFMAFGFTIGAWEVLAAALKRHVTTHEVASTRLTPYGIHYSIAGAIETPDKRNPQVRSVWKIETDATIPALVTAYPLEISVEPSKEKHDETL